MRDMSDRPDPVRRVRETTSFRLPAVTLERLDARARAIGTTRTTLAEQFLEEGLRLVEHPGIRFVDGPSGRRPGVIGTGLDVWEVVETIRANHGSIDEAADYLGIPAAHARVAARYYAAFPVEIDEWIAGNQAVYDRELELAQRERELLG
jgi:uncharacterized protein (DUF433 family)